MPPRPRSRLLALAAVVLVTLSAASGVKGSSRQHTRSSADACTVARAAPLLRQLVAAFNAGNGSRFAHGFARRGSSFQPYGLRRPRVGRRAIARFVTERAKQGDRWVIRSIRGSTTDRYYGDSRGRIYTLFLDVRGRSTQVITGGAATASVRCDTGLVLHWLGPAKAPR